MKKISTREARQSLTHLDRILADEGEVVVTPAHCPFGTDWQETTSPFPPGSS